MQDSIINKNKNSKNNNNNKPKTMKEKGMKEKEEMIIEEPTRKRFHFLKLAKFDPLDKWQRSWIVTQRMKLSLNM